MIAADLLRAKKRWERANLNVGLARSAFRDAIRDAKAAGMGQAEIGRVLGWSRQRVQQVLDGRR